MISSSVPTAQAPADVKKILVADDQPCVLLVLEEFLKRNGFFVITCEDGKEAVRKTKAENPDIVILDGLMPCMSGPEAALEILENHTIPIIIYSSCPEMEEKTPAGCLFVLKSPDSIARLVEEVKRLTTQNGGDHERKKEASDCR